MGHGSRQEVLATLLKNYKEHVDTKWLPKFYATIDTQFGGDYTKYVDYLWEKSLLMKKGPSSTSTRRDMRRIQA